MKKYSVIYIINFIILCFLLNTVSCSNDNSKFTYNYTGIINARTVNYLNLYSENFNIKKDNTICFFNENNNNLFYFSHPVFYKNTQNIIDFDFKANTGYLLDIFADYKFIFESYDNKWIFPNKLNDNNGIIGIDEGGAIFKFIFLNIDASESIHKKTITKFNEEKDNLIYVYNNKNYNFTNDLTGFTSEIKLNNHDDINNAYKIYSKKLTLGKKNKYYLGFVDENDGMQYIFQAKGIIDSNNNFFEYNVKYEELNGDEFVIKTEAECEDICFPATLIFSVEHYAEKAIVDSQINYQNDENCFLKSYAILGNHPVYGNCELFMRFSTSNLPQDIKTEKIKSVKLRIKNLFNKETKIKAYSVVDKWCSLTLDAKSMPTKGSLLSESVLGDDNYYYIDITDLYNNLYKNEYAITQLGICLQTESGFTIIPTTDNNQFPVSVLFDYKP